MAQQSRFRLRFSLKILLLAFTFVALYFSNWADSARRQKAAVAWVRDQGGHVTYDYEWTGGPSPSHRNLPLPGRTWIRERLGIDFLTRVTSVILDRDEISNLTPLAELRDLRAIGLMNNVNLKTDFTPLSSLKRLEQLHLNYTGIDLAKLDSIKALLPHCEIKSMTDPELNSGVRPEEK